MTRIAGLDIDNMRSVDAMEHARTLNLAVIWTRGDRLANERSYAEKASRAIAHAVMQRGMVAPVPTPEPKKESPAASIFRRAAELQADADACIDAILKAKRKRVEIPEIIIKMALRAEGDYSYRARECAHMAMQMGMR